LSVKIMTANFRVVFELSVYLLKDMH